MVLPTGAISLSQVNTELGKSASAAVSLNDTAVRALAGKASGAISMNDLRGKSAYTREPASGDMYSRSAPYYFWNTPAGYGNGVTFYWNTVLDSKGVNTPTYNNASMPWNTASVVIGDWRYVKGNQREVIMGPPPSMQPVIYISALYRETV